MLDDRHATRESRGEWVGLVLALVGAAVLGTLAGTRVSETAFDRTGPPRVDRTASLTERLLAMDAAVADRDRSRAVHAWREAYGLALGARGWRAMVEMGDAALRLEALMGADEPTFPGFRAEARQAYLIALFRARDARAPEGIARISDAFSALGDDEVAAGARGIHAEARR